MNARPRDSFYGQHRWFSDVYSFVPGNSVNEGLIRQLGIGADEKVAGIYFNDETHFIVFTQKAFYWVKKEKEVVCPYSNIARLKLPDNDQDTNDEREIEVVLKDGDFLFLPVVNDTDDFLDIYCAVENISFWIRAFENVQALTDLIVKLKSEIAAYKIQPASWKQPLPVSYLETVTLYLEGCLEQCANGRSFLDVSSYESLNLDQPATWRLLAEVLLAPKTMGTE